MRPGGFAFSSTLGAPPNGGNQSGSPFSGYAIVDLTHPFDKDTIYWPTSPSIFELTPIEHGHREGGYFYSAYRFCAPEHGGTHIDAPMHFAERGRTLDQIPPERLSGPAAVIDVRQKARRDADYRLTVEDILAWEHVHGPIPEGAMVMLRTGWGERWPERKRYLGDDTPGDASKLHFPSYGKEAAEYLTGRRKIHALGVDTASVDYGPSKDFIVHRIAAAADVAGLENIARLEKVPPTGAWIIALPMKIGGGSGGPVRIIALVPK